MKQKLIEQLEKLSGKKVVLEAFEDTHGLDPDKGFYHGKTNKEFIKSLNVLQTYLTPEGYEVVKKFALDAAGINRFGILELLVKLFTGKIESVSKTQLRSYANTSLWKLLETGDLKEVGRGKIIAGNKKSAEEALKLALKALSINEVYSDQIIAELSKYGYSIK